MSTRDFAELRAAVACLVLNHTLGDPAQFAELNTPNATTDPVRLLLDNAGLEEVLEALADELNIAFVDLSDPTVALKPDQRLVASIGPDRLAAVGALPMRDARNQLVVVAVNPFETDFIDLLRAELGQSTYRTALGLPAQVQDQLTLLGSGTPAVLESRAAGGPAERRQVLDWTESLLQRAVAERASDLHIQYTRDGRLRIRLRVDGEMRPGPMAPAGRESEVVGALMNKAGMDVANLLIPQDGTFSFDAAGRTVDCRASMMPQDTGASLVLRLLDPAIARLRIDDMGLPAPVVASLKRLVNAPAGAIFSSGPTGSGKTTTMYALLRELDADRRNIVTIEDPIEYRIPSIGQTQVRHDLGDKTLSFPRALRAVLRHDPDVILIGECRDAETATTAMEASITGHLVLSTVHAPSAPAVFARLQQMGAPRYMVADGLSAVLAQRLIRRLHGCAKLEAPTDREVDLLTSWGKEVPALLPHPKGCEACRYNGYLGRVVVVEMLEPTPKLRELIMAGASVGELEAAARETGWVPMLDDGLRHVDERHTTVEELSRTLSGEGRGA